jgi:hypothetical protein
MFVIYTNPSGPNGGIVPLVSTSPPTCFAVVVNKLTAPLDLAAWGFATLVSFLMVVFLSFKGKPFGPRARLIIQSAVVRVR